DGDHFRIWVSDELRPEEVELEGRSTGLQWFLSFYLVFLVESRDTHSDCILLLDEPGHSLHPLAQRDLSEFFDSLAKHNQLLYTTHSPFLVDADRLDRARKVFVAPDGTSKATSDLGADGGDVTKRGAGYAVHAALGLSVAEGLLIGCEPVVVEGPSDQHYLTAIKILLVRNGSINPSRELIFPPAGGAKGIKAIASILGGRNDSLPIAFLDNDQQGTRFAKDLRNNLYQTIKERVLVVGSYIEIENAEVEDLIPAEIIIKVIDRMIREPEAPFEDHYESGKSIIPQIEAWAKDGGAALERGWKVELAKRVKRTLLDGAEVPSDTLKMWINLFKDFLAGRSA
ncbi:MAG: OLD family endonuclease, partial [Candidatus Electrothrix sp. ATG2]|nr:OLD family endonuclease [Candidatus Electrothrix sp. ATG2]